MGNIIKAMEELQSIEKVNIKGKEYATVASRVGIFRKYFPAHSIITDIVIDDEQRVIIKASIFDENNRLISTGYAEEIRGQGLINTTSAIENAETSAIGRALAAFGLIGGEYASSNEVENAIAKQNNLTNSNISKSTSTDIKSIIQQENEKLKEANLSVLLQDDMLIIQGKSFGHQNLIKKLGYKWNPSKKVWYKPLLKQAS
jgi:hypothetical protein